MWIHRFKWVVCLMFAIFGVVFMVWQHERCESILVKNERARDLEADAVARALLIYQLEHAGNNPASVNDLEKNIKGIDVSLYRTLPIGSRIGRRNINVIFEVPEYTAPPSRFSWCAQGRRKKIIQIYQDGGIGFRYLDDHNYTN